MPPASRRTRVASITHAPRTRSLCLQPRGYLPTCSLRRRLSYWSYRHPRRKFLDGIRCGGLSDQRFSLMPLRTSQKQSYPLKLLANSWQPAESRRSQNLPARRAEPPASKPVTRSKDQDDTRDSLAEVDRASEPRGATPSLRARRMSQEVATSHGNTRACPCCVRLRNWVQSVTTVRSPSRRRTCVA